MVDDVVDDCDADDCDAVDNDCDDDDCGINLVIGNLATPDMTTNRCRLSPIFSLNACKYCAATLEAARTGAPQSPWARCNRARARLGERGALVAASSDTAVD